MASVFQDVIKPSCDNKITICLIDTYGNYYSDLIFHCDIIVSVKNTYILPFDLMLWLAALVY